MEAGSHTIFLCALFIFSAEGKVYKHLIVRSHYVYAYMCWKTKTVTLPNKNYQEEAKNLCFSQKMCCIFLKNESLIQLDNVYENVKVQCDLQRTCRNIEVIISQ